MKDIVYIYLIYNELSAALQINKYLRFHAFQLEEKSAWSQTPCSGPIHSWHSTRLVLQQKYKRFNYIWRHRKNIVIVKLFIIGLFNINDDIF